MKRTLNVGCGNDFECTDRIDMYKTPATTKVVDLNKKFPYKDNTFSYIKARSILEHLKNVGHFIDECYRVLKPGGKLFIRTDFAGCIYTHLFDKYETNNSLRNHYIKGGGFGHSQNEDGHYYLFVESNLRIFLKKFKQVEIKYVAGGRNKIMHFILKSIPRNLGACHIEAYAIK